MKARLIERHLRAELRRYPAVLLVGPRQSGKTTLAKTLSPVYFDLENPQDQLRLDATWTELLHEKRPILIDEAQAYPSVFPRVRSAIDEQRKRVGRFVLLGSIAPSLMRDVSEALTGRIGVVELRPFAWRELDSPQRDRLWIRGGYPDGGVLKPGNYPGWQRNYLRLLAQRDLPTWGLPARPQTTERLFRLLAALHGQLWNASEIGGSLGLSYHTVNSYLEYLEHAFLIRVLRPFSANLRKRLVKSPRVYWADSGLMHALLSAPRNQRELLSQPWVGRSWEGWVISQILDHLTAGGRPFEAYHFRTSDRMELDLVLVFDRHLWAIEIKLTSTPSPSNAHTLQSAAELIGATQRLLISRTAETVSGREFISTNLQGALDLLLPT
jgi:hypothetical protein